MTIFDDLVKLACDFVEEQKGKWDHSAWMGFLSEVQKTGGRLTEDMQNYLGLILESIKKFNELVSDASKKVMEVVCEETVRFVEQSRGIWDHSGWEKFLSNIKNKGVDLTSEAVSQLGSVLESTKLLYKSIPADLKEEEKQQTNVKEQISIEPEPQKVEKEIEEEAVETVIEKQPSMAPGATKDALEEHEKEPESVKDSLTMLDKVQEAIDKREVSSIIPLKIQKLTKKQLMELEQGRYLVSHAVDEFGNPIFAREIPPADDREDFWLTVRDASLNQRVCYLFQDKTEYITFQAQQNK